MGRTLTAVGDILDMGLARGRGKKGCSMWPCNGGLAMTLTTVEGNEKAVKREKRERVERGNLGGKCQES